VRGDQPFYPNFCAIATIIVRCRKGSLRAASASSQLNALPIFEPLSPGAILRHIQNSQEVGQMKQHLLGVFLVAILSACAAAQTYTITDIGVLKGDNESNGFFINSSGAVVGCSDTANSEGYPCTGTGPGQHAFYWTKSGGLKDLGTLPGGNISGAIGLNDSGQVVGYSNTSTGLSTEFNFTAFEWTSSGGMINLGKLSGGNSSCAFEINSAGVIAGDSFISSSVVDAASWTNDKIKNLGGLSKSIFTAGLAINNNGEIAGESVFSYGPPFTSHAFQWSSAHGMTDLGTLSGGNTSIANGLNNSDIVIGQSNSGSSLYWHAVKWDASNKITDLGTLVGGTYSIAFGINDSSEIVGYGNIGDNAAHAILWTSAAGMQDLNNMIPANSGWVLINANAINASGEIVGYGTKGGHNHAFLLTPSN
jgi:probable HAF family extracellular repeat protein